MVKTVKKRTEIEDAYKWSIEHLFASDEVWKAEYNRVLKQLPELINLKGTLSNSAENLYNVLQKNDEIAERLSLVHAYANLKLNEDNTNTAYQSLSELASHLAVEMDSAASFIEPEILELGLAKLKQFMEYEPLARYGHYLQNLTRMASHVLSTQMEEVLAKFSELGGAPKKIFTMINDADMKFDPVIDDSGALTELTHGNYTSMLESPNADVRKAAFKSMYKSYIAQRNTLAATYSASVKKDILFAKERKFKSSIEASLAGTNIPVSVYKNLIKTVESHLPSLHKYVQVRKKALKLDKIHMYDLYVPIVKDIDIKISYDKAVETVTKSLAPLGADYVNNLVSGFSGGWVDVYENEGKHSGAFSWGPYGSHPFVLMNYHDNVKNMFTLAHEMGHAMHSFYTSQTQPYVYGGHTLFVAEVASTVNEALLMEYLLKTTTDEPMRKYLANFYMEQFRGTLFRQTMFAEFEMIAHEMAEADEPLTTNNLNELYRNLNQKYYGPDIVLDEEINFEWSKVPHFYRPYYVYQYATGYSAAIALSKLILTGGEHVNNYLTFLKGGDSMYSIDLLKGAGVDMASAAPVDLALEVFDTLVNQFA